MPVISHRRARLIYDRFGARQDHQAFYEMPAERDLLSRSGFEQATSVLEFGCGTGRLAAHLLTHYLPGQASYLGVDLSSTMVGLTRRRLKPWPNRAQVLQTDGSIKVPSHDGGWDRFVSCYVMDLLSEGDIQELLNEAYRLLNPEGRLCLISLTFGETPLASLVSAGWGLIHAIAPGRMGGCRPVHLLPFLKPSHWGIEYRNVVTRWGISSEVVVAHPLASQSTRP